MLFADQFSFISFSQSESNRMFCVWIRVFWQTTTLTKLDRISTVKERKIKTMEISEQREKKKTNHWNKKKKKSNMKL